MKKHYINELPENWLPAARVFAALGDDMRQKILLLFEKNEEISIKQIVEIFPLSRTAMVHHLSVLERAGIISQRKSGKEVRYSLHPNVVLHAIDQLRQYILEEFYDQQSE